MSYGENKEKGGDMRVVEVISDTNIGGAGVLLLNRLRHVEDKAETVVLLPKGSKLLQRVKNTGARVVEMRGCSDRSFDIFSIPEILYKLRKLKPDVVNSHGCLSSRIAARLSGATVSVYTRHCSYPLPGCYTSRCVRAITKKLTELLSDAVIAVSPVVKKDLRSMGVCAKSIKVIVNGAERLRVCSDREKEEVRQMLGIPNKAKVVSIFARLEHCKDHECFLKAARVLCDTSNEYYFLVVGTGSTEAALKSMRSELNLGERVVFTGFVEDISPLMSITDVNVNCSVGTETSSLALSEGMSIGVPSVASDFGGNPYMVRDGVNGLIYPRGNHRKLAECILRLADGEFYTKASKNSLVRFNSELNAERMAQSTYRFYEELLQNKKGKNG